jgi:hypothetical protein
VLLAVPKGLYFSTFEFGGEGQIACGDCHADFSHAPFSNTTYDKPPTNTDIKESQQMTTETQLHFYDPRYFFSRPLVIKSVTDDDQPARAVKTAVIIKTHGRGKFATSPKYEDIEVDEDIQLDGETAFYLDHHDDYYGWWWW